MQCNLSCIRDTVVTRTVHQCSSQPLRCRTFKATPRTSGQWNRSRPSTRSQAAKSGRPSSPGFFDAQNTNANVSKPDSGKRPGSPSTGRDSPSFGEKQVEVKVYNSQGEPTTELRTVKIDKVEAAAVQQYSTAAEEQSKRLKEAETRASGEQAVDDTTEAVQQGVDQAADAAAEGADRFAEGVSDAADEFQKNADEFQQDAEEIVEDIEEAFESAADQAADRLAGAADQVQSAAQGAADSASNFVDSLQKGAQSGSPYKNQPLSTLEPNPYEGRSGRKPSAEVQSNYFKLRLMECIAGLDRGFAANSFAAMQVESAALALTEQSEPVSLSWTAASGQEEKQSGLAQLSGTWRLVYSSGFSSGSIGGRRPGPTPNLLPGRLGQVYQVISPYTSRLDNVLELYTGLPGFEPVILTASLKHNFEAVGGNIVQITFEDTEVKVTGGIGGLLGNLPEIMVPQLPEPFKPSRQQRTSSFDVLYLDSDLRITRGSRGELRIFVKT